jgi:hypothetical protein
MEGDPFIHQEVDGGNIKMGINSCDEVGTESWRMAGFVSTFRVLLPESLFCSLVTDGTIYNKVGVLLSFRSFLLSFLNTANGYAHI